MPNPAMTGIGDAPFVWTQVYGTNSCGKKPCTLAQLSNIPYKIPTYAIPYPPSGDSAQSLNNALPSVASTTEFSWSPTVMYIDGRFLMYYTATHKNTAKKPCLVAATSTDGQTFTELLQSFAAVKIAVTVFTIPPYSSTPITIFIWHGVIRRMIAVGDPIQNCGLFN